MVATTSTSTSLKEYLKKYENNDKDEKKKKKKKTKTVATGVRVVDEDPVWQKPVNIEEEEDEPDGEPQVDEDINFKCIRRLELLKARGSYNQISEDGSGWVSLSDAPNRSTYVDSTSDISPPRNRKARYDTPSPEAGRNPSVSPEPNTTALDAGNSELSPPLRQGRIQISPSPVSARKSLVSGARDIGLRDLSPPRRARPFKSSDSRGSEDLSPPRKSRKGNDKMSTSENASRQMSKEEDLSPPRKGNAVKRTGLITGKDVSEEIAKIKNDEWSRFNEMDPSTSGRGAEPVYRVKGKRVSKDEFLKLTKKQEKPKEEEKKLEWGKGLAQKREAEAKLQELELEKAKPFARSRDDPELDRMMKDRLRWGDPMAHLVKTKQSDLMLPDFGESEKMQESGFIVPQVVPSHSWLKRGLDFEPNRYGIKPGRHWDGVNRSNGYEKQLFKRTNEKKATEREAYLWSVSDM